PARPSFPTRRSADLGHDAAFDDHGVLLRAALHVEAEHGVPAPWRAELEPHLFGRVRPDAYATHGFSLEREPFGAHAHDRVSGFRVLGAHDHPGAHPISRAKEAGQRGS